VTWRLGALVWLRHELSRHTSYERATRDTRRRGGLTSLQMSGQCPDSTIIIIEEYAPLSLVQPCHGLPPQSCMYLACVCVRLSLSNIRSAVRSVNSDCFTSATNYSFSWPALSLLFWSLLLPRYNYCHRPRILSVLYRTVYAPATAPIADAKLVVDPYPLSTTVTRPPTYTNTSEGVASYS
jgi:hypothetical protein